MQGPGRWDRLMKSPTPGDRARRRTGKPLRGRAHKLEQPLGGSSVLGAAGAPCDRQPSAGSRGDHRRWWPQARRTWPRATCCAAPMRGHGKDAGMGYRPFDRRRRRRAAGCARLADPSGRHAARAAFDAGCGGPARWTSIRSPMPSTAAGAVIRSASRRSCIRSSSTLQRRRRRAPPRRALSGACSGGRRSRRADGHGHRGGPDRIARPRTMQRARSGSTRTERLIAQLVAARERHQPLDFAVAHAAVAQATRRVDQVLERRAVAPAGLPQDRAATRRRTTWPM